MKKKSVNKFYDSSALRKEEKIYKRTEIEGKSKVKEKESCMKKRKNY
jgi:hypothetical protein